MKNKLNEKRLKEILDQEQFEYKESAWNKFDSLHKESIDKRDRRPYFFIFFLLSLFSLCAVWYLNSPNDYLTKDSFVKSDTSEGLTRTTKLEATKNNNPSNSLESVLTDSVNKTNTIHKKTQKDKALKSTKSKEYKSALAKTNLETRSQRKSESSTILNKGYNRSIKTTELSYATNSTSKKTNSKNDTNNNTATSQRSILKNLPFLKSVNINGIPFYRKNIWTCKVPMIKKTKAFEKSLLVFGSSLIGIGNKKNIHSTSLLGLELVWTKNISLELGVGYKWNNVTELESHRGFSTKYNSLNQQFYHNTIEADKLNLLHLPLRLNYKLSSKIIGSCGINYNFLFLTKGTIRDNKEGELQERSTWIVEEGINRNLLGINLSIRYRLNDNLQMESGFNQNLSSSFSQPNGENAKLANVSLGLRYYLKK